MRSRLHNIPLETQALPKKEVSLSPTGATRRATGGFALEDNPT